MAEQEMGRIAAEAGARFGVTQVAIVHRTGRIAIGEASVAIAVAAPHRAAAIDACRFVIDTLKTTVPIWKREHFEGGEVWIEGAGD
jgi:molybdopterin synthase catalytic subunit